MSECAHVIDHRLRAKLCSGELYYGTPVLQPLIYFARGRSEEKRRAISGWYLPQSYPLPPFAWNSTKPIYPPSGFIFPRNL